MQIIQKKGESKNMKTKKAISLIVLVITIIVMIILAGAVIVTISNTNIIERARNAKEQADLKTMQELVQTLWADAYVAGARTKVELETAVTTGLVGVDTSKYDIDVRVDGVTVTLRPAGGGEQEESEWITAWVDEVPIPKGFVASPYGADTELGIPAENDKDTGLVIYELTTDEIERGVTELPNEGHSYSLRNRNQYVWVPVDELTREKFFPDTDEDYSSITISDTVGVLYWEATPDIDLDATYDNPTYQQCIDKNWGSSTECAEWNPPITVSNLVTERTLDEVTEMYESVEEYGGFYIARYETGLMPTATAPTDTATDVLKGRSNVGSMMNLQPYNYIGWNDDDVMTNETGGAVEVARSLYTKEDEEYGVISTLTYGVQWDAVVQLLEDSEYDILVSTDYGNYYTHAIAYADLNEGASYAKWSNWTLGTFGEVGTEYAKTDSERHLLTTGALKDSNTNNIYDIAGNLCEWTMEGYSSDNRVVRGGDFINYGSGMPVAYRSRRLQSWLFRQQHWPTPLTLYKDGRAS